MVSWNTGLRCGSLNGQWVCFFLFKYAVLGDLCVWVINSVLLLQFDVQGSLHKIQEEKGINICKVD